MVTFDLHSKALKMKTKIKFKPGVTLDLESLQDPMPHALFVAALTCPDGGTLTVTSQSDGTHKADSLHYLGRAWDIRIRDLPHIGDARDWANNLKDALGPDWDVILESDHLHLEYQPHGTAGKVKLPSKYW